MHLNILKLYEVIQKIELNGTCIIPIMYSDYFFNAQFFFK